MTKKTIHKRFMDQLAAELESITAAAKKSIATATDDEHRAESKYDTFKIESSFLARGLAKRVEDLTGALDSLQMLPLKKLRKNSPIQLGALVRLKANDGETRTLLFGSAAGGETIMVDNEEIIIVTSGSPLGQAVLGKIVGDTFDLTIGGATHAFTVVSVE
jgi:transcription elongation GreA/GreB family factor